MPISHVSLKFEIFKWGGVSCTPVPKPVEHTYLQFAIDYLIHSSLPYMLENFIEGEGKILLARHEDIYEK
jgi:hypothetical protein